jgi:hypothetical protein
LRTTQLLRTCAGERQKERRALLIWDISSSTVHVRVTGRCHENLRMFGAEDTSMPLWMGKKQMWRQQIKLETVSVWNVDVEIRCHEESNQQYFQLTAFMSQSMTHLHYWTMPFFTHRREACAKLRTRGQSAEWLPPARHAKSSKQGSIFSCLVKFVIYHIEFKCF